MSWPRTGVVCFNPESDAPTRPLEELGVVASTIARSRLATTAMTVRGLYAELRKRTGKAPCWRHPMRVMLTLKDYGFVTEAGLHAALLHDVLETFHGDPGDLQTLGYPREVRTIVGAVTRQTDVPYLAWIEGIAAGNDLQAMLVKYASILDRIRHEGRRMDENDLIVAKLAEETLVDAIASMIESTKEAAR